MRAARPVSRLQECLQGDQPSVRGTAALFAHVHRSRHVSSHNRTVLQLNVKLHLPLDSSAP